MRKLKADVVLGFGGYPSFPGGIAAKVLGKPLVIHEQNAVAGLTNKLLGKLASQVFLGFPGAASSFNKSAHKIHVVGNPVRAQIKNKHLPAGTTDDSQANEKPLNLLVLGGSLGAKPLNKGVPESLRVLTGSANIRVVHQCGKGNREAVSQAYQAYNVHAEVRDFIDDMAGAYEWADAVVCRAGALTVAEIAKAGVAACFVPLPHAVDDHQTKNAEYLVSQEAAVLLPQNQLAERLHSILNNWIEDRAICKKMGKTATQCLPNKATDAIVAACQQYIKES